MLSKNITAISAKNQLEDFVKNRKPSFLGDVVKFTGVDGYDVYNPSIPFQIDGETVLAGRVENRANEVSQTKFFRRTSNENEWTLIADAPVLDLQDPFVTTIGDETFLGGVYVIWDGDRVVEYSTYFYRGKTLKDLKLAFKGPKFMKDIRLLELSNGKIAVFSRPQGEKMIKEFGCVCKIGFAIADSIDMVNEDFIENAKHLEGQFTSDEWGGCNQLYNLKNGLIGIIGHKSWGETVDGVFVIHYYSMAFAINPNTLELTQTKIIGTRNCYPIGPQKNARTADVTFTSGIIRLDNGKAELYSGLNDCEVGKIIIEDPLTEYEALEF